jgi:hypothetical protein
MLRLPKSEREDVCWMLVVSWQADQQAIALASECGSVDLAFDRQSDRNEVILSVLQGLWNASRKTGESSNGQ